MKNIINIENYIDLLNSTSASHNSVIVEIEELKASFPNLTNEELAKVFK